MKDGLIYNGSLGPFGLYFLLPPVRDLTNLSNILLIKEEKANLDPSLPQIL